jgi:predicted nucleic-acid-binding protein
MIALDTNVLVRFLVEDDPAQTRRAKAVLQKALDAGEALFVPEVVLCEVAWVLQRRYEYGRAEIGQVLGELLRARQLSFSDGEKIGRAVTAYKSGRGGFSDNLIAEDAKSAGCGAVATFDRKLLREPGFSAP